jgi:hypothetical protein
VFKFAITILLLINHWKLDISIAAALAPTVLILPIKVLLATYGPATVLTSALIPTLVGQYTYIALATILVTVDDRSDNAVNAICFLLGSLLAVTI